MLEVERPDRLQNDTVVALVNMNELTRSSISVHCTSWQNLRRVSHFHFYENLVAANLGMRFTLWQLRAATRNS